MASTQQLMMRYSSAFFGQCEPRLNRHKIDLAGGRSCHLPRLSSLIAEPRDACRINSDHGSVSRKRQIEAHCRRKTTPKVRSQRSPFLANVQTAGRQYGNNLAGAWNIMSCGRTM